MRNEWGASTFPMVPGTRSQALSRELAQSQPVIKWVTESLSVASSILAANAVLVVKGLSSIVRRDRL